METHRRKKYRRVFSKITWNLKGNKFWKIIPFVSKKCGFFFFLSATLCSIRHYFPSSLLLAFWKNMAKMSVLLQSLGSEFIQASVLVPAALLPGAGAGLLWGGVNSRWCRSGHHGDKINEQRLYHPAAASLLSFSIFSIIEEGSFLTHSWSLITWPS